MKTTLNVTGMHCASCAVNIAHELREVPGVQEAQVNYATHIASIEHGDGVTQDALRAAVVRAGYGVHREEPDAHAHHAGLGIAKKRAVWASAFAFPVLVLSMLPIESTWLPFVLGVVSSCVVLLCGASFHATTWRMARRFRANMDTLVTLGTFAALLLSWWEVFRGGAVYFEAAAVITAFLLIGRFAEAKSKGRASEAMEKLLSLAPSTAHVLREGNVVDVVVADVLLGEHILVRPGERVPLDGEIIEGKTSIDESMATGESVAVVRTVGMAVLGGTMNIDGAITVATTKTAETSFVAEVARMVKDAQTHKAPIEYLVDRIAGVFVPTVVVLAVVTGLVTFWGAGSLEVAVLRAVAVLVVACPCALGLATPIAVLVGSGAGATKGVFVKDGGAFEVAAHVSALFLDKTGTLTKGTPVVTDVFPKKDRDDVLLHAQMLAGTSSHPLSKAIVAYGDGETVRFAGESTTVPGEGVRGSVGGNVWMLGSRGMLEHAGIVPLDPPAMDSWTREGKSLVYFAQDGVCSLVFALQDEIQDGAKEAIARCHDMGLEVTMVTGDHEASARAIAGMLGIENVIAGVTPAGKRDVVRTAKDKGDVVAFVGDGINDAPALALADLGIAVGSGADVAREAGNVMLLAGGPRAIVDVLRLTRGTYRVMKQNLFWAFLYNIVSIPLAMVGLLSPMIAGGAMAFSSVSVVLNALRLRKFGR